MTFTTTREHAPSPHTMCVIAATAVVGLASVKAYYDPALRPKMRSTTVTRIEAALRALRWEALLRPIGQGEV